MRAAVYERYGPPEVVAIRDVPTPTPKADEVLIQIRASTVSSGDWRARSLEMPPGFGALGRLVFGITRPRQPILGTELSGVVAEVGAEATAFKVGDEVFAFANAAMGSHAEYRCIAANGLIAHKPSNPSFEQAAALSFGGMTMLNFFRRGAEVTGVCSTANVDLVRSIGAHHVIDYTREDFTANGATYDVIVDTVGNASFARVKRSLAEGGRLLVVLGGFADLLRAPFVGMTGTRKVIAGPAPARVEDIRQLARIAAAGALKPVIDETLPLERIVEAHRRVETVRKRGSVVVTVAT